MRKISVESTVDAIVNQIVNALATGALKAGQKLPPEADLAKEFGVGRNSVREAIKILSAYGVVEIRRADGTYICSSFSPRMLNPLIYGILLEDTPMYLIEVRDAIEHYLYYLAIKKADEDDLRQLKSALDDLLIGLQRTEPDVHEICVLDGNFHSAIALCSHNPILIQINRVVVAMLYQSRLETIRSIMDAGEKQFLIDVHQQTYDVIVNRDHDGVDSAVQRSTMQWSAFIQSKELEK